MGEGVSAGLGGLSSDGIQVASDFHEAAAVVLLGASRTGGARSRWGVLLNRLMRRGVRARPTVQAGEASQLDFLIFDGPERFLDEMPGTEEGRRTQVDGWCGR